MDPWREERPMRNDPGEFDWTGLEPIRDALDPALADEQEEEESEESDDPSESS